MKEKLSNTCMFPEVFKSKNRNPETEHPKNEMGYFRADYDGYRWWNTVFKVHREMETTSLIKEFDSVYNRFTKEFKDLKAVQRFCWTGNAEKVSDTEFNAYLRGRYGCYWFRFILRRGDYNLYLHCYKRAKP